MRTSLFAPAAAATADAPAADARDTAKALFAGRKGTHSKTETPRKPDDAARFNG
jgi:hypothetical protein